MNTLGYGVLGCGAVSRRHMDIIETSPGMRLAAIADRQIEHACEMSSRYQSRPTVYQDYHALLEDPGVDVVVICLPSQFHAEAAIAAAEAEKHIYCEKIMATTVSEAQAMIRAAHAAGVKLMIGHHTRWCAPFAQARRIIESGRIGEIVAIDGAFASQAFLPDTVRPTFWGIKAGARGHGKIMNFGTHYADTAAFLAGEQFARINAFITNRFSSGQAPEDQYVVTAVCQSEAIVTIAQYSQLHSIAERTRGFVVYGTEGTLETYYQPNSVALKVAGDDMYRPIPLEDDLSHIDPWLRLHTQLRQCIEDDTEPLVTGADGMRALQWAVAAYLSAESEQWVDLPLGEQWWDYSGPVLHESLPQAQKW
ncbi:MAG: Gfo/Idh/MocA family oxidoreductase [candidate division WS1 bacterium]|nr:Gfo/Idh/MocA family oxidoreductase [candidate division WS1 bacterium]